MNAAGEFIRDHELYFLDGISGGFGFLLPGETVAATTCFTCETTPLPEEWNSAEFVSIVEDATGVHDFSTAVEVTVGNISFENEGP